MRRLLRNQTNLHSNSLTQHKQRGQYRTLYSLDSNISSFTPQKVSHFHDFNLQYVNLFSNQFGVRWHHFDNEEENNTMLFLFPFHKSIPLGVRYSLEKMLQCGSKKYPIRNIPEHMIHRSFNTSDLTTSTNDYLFTGFQTSLEKDHLNLMDTYLSMLLDPLLRKQDFRQVIWRYQSKGNGVEMVGELTHENQHMWQFNETKIQNVIEKKLLGKEGLPTIQDLREVTFADVTEAHKKIFRLDNLHIFSHGDLHPVVLAPKLQTLIKGYKKEKSVNPKIQKKQLKEPPNIQTFTVQQLEVVIPLVLSFKIPHDIPAFDRFLLPILSYLLFDMPESPFMEWNSAETPYPRPYGYHEECFNIGITMKNKDGGFKEKDFLDEEKKIREKLEQLCKNKFKNDLIEKCLYHLEGQYFSNNGLKIVDGCIDKLMVDPSGESLGQILQVRKNISKVLKNYRKNNIFQSLIQKYIVSNDFYVRVWGKHQPNLMQNLARQQENILQNIFNKMTPSQRNDATKYEPPTLLQNKTILPKLQLNQLELFQQRQMHQPKIVNDVKVYYNHIPNNIRITMKYDITDIEEDEIKLLPVLCEVFPFMGGKHMNPDAFSQYLDTYIKNIEMKYETTKTQNGMKIYAYLVVEFTQRNGQHGFNVCDGLVNAHNQQNIFALSSMIQKAGNKAYNDISEKLIQYHGRHIASTRSAFAMMENPLFNARSLCSLASDIRKIASPKKHLESVAYQLAKITNKFVQRQRIQVLFQCRKECKQKYERYIELILQQLTQKGIKPTTITTLDYEPQSCMKYFPNYQSQYVFEAFTVPYENKPEQVPTSFVFSSLVNGNIKTYNDFGGCFLFKGALVSYLRGGRKKFIELEDYYKKIQNIQQAKIQIFKHFRRYNASDYFYSGVTAEQNRNFKMAVSLVEKEHVEGFLQKYILEIIKEGKSSMLALGQHLPNYDPLIKKGWEVERSIEGMSLRMQGENYKVLPLSTSKYINIY